MKFCSRCGLPLSGLSEWLAVSGLPAGSEQQTQVDLRSPRRKGIRRGQKVMFFSGMLFPVFLLITILVEEAPPMFVPIITFLVGLTIMLYSRLFGEEYPVITSKQPPTFGSMSGGQALPSASSVPLVSFPEQLVRTNELAQPSSVTEHTTRLLDQD